MAHWSERYVGMPYKPGEFDCADLVVLVQREIFKREVSLPSEHAQHPAGRARQILDLRNDYARPTAQPKEGDAALLITRGRLQHIGVLCLVGAQRWVLHNAEGAGVVMHSVPMLAAHGYSIEDYYTWI